MISSPMFFCSFPGNFLEVPGRVPLVFYKHIYFARCSSANSIFALPFFIKHDSVTLGRNGATLSVLSLQCLHSHTTDSTLGNADRSGCCRCLMHCCPPAAPAFVSPSCSPETHWGGSGFKAVSLCPWGSAGQFTLPGDTFS